MVRSKIKPTMLVGNRFKDDYSLADKFSNTMCSRGRKKKKSNSSSSSKSRSRNKWVISYLPKKEN